MLERARLWTSLTPEQKRMARAGADRWREANPQQRQRLREIYQRMQTLPPPTDDPPR